MTFDELVASRRSIRQYNEKKVSRGEIEALVNAAIWAPSGGNLQMWCFVVIRDKKTLDKIKMFSPGMSRTAPCVIAICVDSGDAGEKGREFIKKTALLDIGFAAQNILLKANDLGLGACAVKSYNEKSVGRILELPDQASVLMLITIGHYDNMPKPPARKSLSEAMRYESWEGEVKVSE